MLGLRIFSLSGCGHDICTYVQRIRASQQKPVGAAPRPIVEKSRKDK
jgi:hypothetical protein